MSNLALEKPNFVEVWLQQRKVGRLALTLQGLAAFEYSSEFLSTGISISPLQLPLNKGVFVARSTPFQGNFGVFDDSLPDGWGRLILSRFLQSKAINPDDLNLLQLLSITGSTGRGALEYRPEQSITSYSTDFNLDNLATEALKIYSSHNYTGQGLNQLFVLGGSPGGVRPKISIRHLDKDWIVKFRASNDPENMGEWEYKYSLLAKKCGVEMPETILLEDKYFATERFDRKSDQKFHVVSVAGLLNADYRTPCIDYLQIFQLTLRITNSWVEMWKLFRLMTFNFLIGNKDDHARNFSFILINDEWKLSPAYDILPSNGFNGFHTTTINNNPSPTENDLMEVASKSGLDLKKAKEILMDMKDTLK